MDTINQGDKNGILMDLLYAAARLAFVPFFGYLVADLVYRYTESILLLGVVISMFIGLTLGDWSRVIPELKEIFKSHRR